MHNSEFNLSIIIPAFNAAQSLAACLRSIECEAPSDVQTIVVDDGSTDGTAAVISSFSQSHPEFTLISVRQSNQGVSAARNAGFRYSAGRFIMFVDADDILEHGWYQALSQYFESDFDIVSFRVAYMKHGRRVVDYSMHEGIYSSDELLRLYCSSYALNSSWARLFSSSFLNRYRLRFIPEVRIGEDALFMGELIKNNASFRQAKNIVYRYEENLMSATHSHIDRMPDSSLLISCKSKLSSRLDGSAKQASAAFLTHSFFSSFSASMGDNKFSPSNFAWYIEHYWEKADMDAICRRVGRNLSWRDRLNVRLVKGKHYRLLWCAMECESVLRHYR